MPVSASAIYFLNLRGDVLINRLYRDDVGGNMVDAFRTHIMQTKELGVCPVRQIGGCSFFYMKISNVYIVIVVSANANVACAFKFVVEAVALFKSYFGGAFDEDAIRNNFVLIYELLDEIMDFGYPQNLSPEILKLYITQEGVRSPFSSKAADKAVPNATLQVTGAVGWRREGLVYKKNEVFLDIVESVNLLMSSKGSVLRCDVTGKVLMKCFLSGMPDLKLGLNDKIGLEKESQLKSRPTKSGKTIELDDVTFHQCVNLTRFNAEKTVSFVPPDGEFELMKYRITEGVNLPFKVLPTIKELGRTRMEVNVKVKSVFSAKMFALGVVVKIPVPKQTAKTNFTVTSGKAKYNASIDCLVWKIRKFPGQTESTLSAEVELISTMTEKKSATKPPIQMEFQVPMFTASGLRVRFLKVWEKSGYNTVEWVRYITKAGSYEIRTITSTLTMALRIPCNCSIPLQTKNLQSFPVNTSFKQRRKTITSELQTQQQVGVNGSSVSVGVPTHKVTVHDRQRGTVHQFLVPEDQYILHTAEDQNITLPFACRHGSLLNIIIIVQAWMQDEVRIAVYTQFKLLWLPACTCIVPIREN
ncbi:hypothetical protein TanjilG_28059 [Lupinus angustifolius]|uniref:MHD domain-containing protein n=2 Tax=Magnoliopsida TaxID=3398 RepID=A0A4P1RGJ4_LUPAN|nr:hypothetical protein TanjilG_28059 [Lupinus angustifolius]